MNAIAKMSQMTHPLALTVGRMIQSATSAAASAIGVALITVPWCAVMAQPGDSKTPASASSALSTQRVESEDVAIRPFRVDIAQGALRDLRKRLLATRWPDKETVADSSQGAQLANLQELVRYWATDYDWREGEARLNAFDVVIPSLPGFGFSETIVRFRSRGRPAYAGRRLKPHIRGVRTGKKVNGDRQ